MIEKNTINAYKALLELEFDTVSTLANTCAFLNQVLDDINWVGFYLLKHNTLVLGPFQGLVACNKINLDQGVCGHAATIKKTVVVDNVHLFSGHIACDQNSNAEVVIPIFVNNKLYGVLDVDSPKLARFNPSLVKSLEEIVLILQNHLTKLSI